MSGPDAPPLEREGSGLEANGTRLSGIPPRAPSLPSMVNTTVRPGEELGGHVGPVVQARNEDPFQPVAGGFDPGSIRLDAKAFLTIPRKIEGPPPSGPPPLDDGVVLPEEDAPLPHFWGAIAQGENSQGSVPAAERSGASGASAAGRGGPGEGTGWPRVPVYTRELPDPFLGMSKFFPVGFFGRMREGNLHKQMKQMRAAMEGMRGHLTDEWERQRMDTQRVAGRAVPDLALEVDSSQSLLSSSLRRGPFSVTNPVSVSISRDMDAPLGSLNASVFRGVQAAAETAHGARIDFEAPNNKPGTLKPFNAGTRLLAEQQRQVGGSPGPARHAEPPGPSPGQTRATLPPVVLQKRPSSASQLASHQADGSRAWLGETSASAVAEGREGATGRGSPPRTGRGPRAPEVDFSHIDPLKWVWKLVQYTETHPIYVPEAKEASGGVKVTADMQFQTTVFPNLNPSRREDAFLLQHWLGDLMASLSATVKGKVVPEGSTAEEISEGAPEAVADSALWVYSVAFEELRRQVQIQCREKAELLTLIWEHFFTLVELRCACRYERDIAAVLAQRDDMARRLGTAHESLVSKEQDRIELHRDKEDEIRTERMAAMALAQRYAHAQGELDSKAQSVAQVESRLKDEIERRLGVEAELQSSRKRVELLKQQLGAVKLMMDQQHESIVRMEANRVDLSATIEHLVGQNKVKEGLLADALKEGEEERERSAKALAAAEEARKMLVAKDKEVAERLAGYTSLESELERTRKSLESAEKRASSEQESSMRLHEQLQLKLDELNQVNLMFARLRRDHTSLTDEFSQHRTDAAGSLSALEEQLVEHRTLAERYRTGLQKADQEILEAVSDNDRMKKQLSEQAGEFLALRAGLIKLVQSIEPMTSNIAEVRDLATLRDDAWDEIGTHGRRQVTLRALHVASDSVVEELRNYRVENAGLRERVDNLEKLRRRIESQVLESKTAMEKAIVEKLAMAKDKDRSDSERERLKHLSDQLEAQNNELRLKNEDAEGTLRQRESEISRLKRRIEGLEGVERDFRATVEDMDGLRKQLYESQARVLELEEEMSVQKQASMDFMKQKIELETRQQDFERNFNRNLTEITTLRTAINVRDQRISQAIGYLGHVGQRIKELKEKNARLSRAMGLLQDRLAGAEMAKGVASFVWPELTRFELKLDHFVQGLAEQFATRTMDEQREALRGEIEGQVLRLLEATDLLDDTYVPVDDEAFWVEVLKPIEPPPPPTSAMIAMLRALQGPEGEGGEARSPRPLSKAREHRRSSVTAPSPTPGGAPPSATPSSVPATPGGLEAVYSQVEEFEVTEHSLRADVFLDKVSDSISLEVLEHAEEAAAAPEASRVRPWYDEVKWLKVQRGLLTRMLRSLRRYFAAEVQTRQNLELQLLNLESRSLSQNIQMQTDFGKAVEDFIFELRPMFGSVATVRKFGAELKDLTADTRSALQDGVQVRTQAEHSATVIREAEEVKKTMVNKEVQVEDPDKERWSTWMDANKPSLTPALTMKSLEDGGGSGAGTPSGQGNSKKFYQKYMAEETLNLFCYEVYHVGMERWKGKQGKISPGETVFDHIEYLTSVKGGENASEQAMNTIAQACRSCARLMKDSETATHPRIRVFARLLNATGQEDGYDHQTYWFLLSCCQMVRNLLGLNWKIFEKDWSKGPCPLPLACADDVCANLFNTTAPAGLMFYDRQMIPLVHESPQGMVIEFDAFLEVLCNEHRAGKCPVSPYSNPRKIIHGGGSGAGPHAEAFDPTSTHVREAGVNPVRFMGGPATQTLPQGALPPAEARRSSIESGNPFPFTPKIRRASVLTNEPPPPVSKFTRMPGATANLAGKNFQGRRMSTAQPDSRGSAHPASRGGRDAATPMSGAAYTTDGDDLEGEGASEGRPGESRGSLQSAQSGKSFKVSIPRPGGLVLESPVITPPASASSRGQKSSPKLFSP